MKVKPEGQLLLVDPKDLSVALKTTNTMIIRVKWLKITEILIMIKVVIYAKRISLILDIL